LASYESYDSIIKTADEKSKPIFEKIMSTTLDVEFKSDFKKAVVSVSTSLITPNSYSLGLTTCKSCPLCKLINCDTIGGYKSEQYTARKWFGGGMWITIPNNGYKCYSNKFNGCWASKLASR